MITDWFYITLVNNKFDAQSYIQLHVTDKPVALGFSIEWDILQLSAQ